MSTTDWLLLILIILLGATLYFVVRLYLNPPLNLPALPPTSDSNAELLALVDALPVGIIVTDVHSEVLSCNATAATLLNLTSTAVLGRSLIYSLRDYELAELLRAALAGRPFAPEFNLTYNHRYLLVNISVLAREEQGFGLVVLQDVTQIRHVEQMRRDFIANVSHEFRTPLATAKLLVETARAANDDPAAIQNFLAKANRELDSLARLVSEMLDLARIEAGQTPVQLRPVTLAEVLGSAVSRAEEQAARRGLHLSLAPMADLMTVMADANRLGQVVGNLVQNAIKFTPAGGSITVSAAPCADPQFATISVADTGIGIPGADLERVFERFYKVDRARAALLADGSEQGGTGLGLAIARHLISAHGGRIWAESDAHGTTFRFTVPLLGSIDDGAGNEA